MICYICSSLQWALQTVISWWRHEMETFSALLAICAGNSPVTGEFPAQRPVTRSFDVLFDLSLNKPLSKQWWGWWFETLARPLWRHCNVVSPCYQGGISLHTDTSLLKINGAHWCPQAHVNSYGTYIMLTNVHPSILLHHDIFQHGR